MTPHLDSKLFTGNRKRFTGHLPEGSLAWFVSNDLHPRNGDQFFPFRQNSDLYYLSGVAQAETTLLLFPGCPNRDLEEVLFIFEQDQKTATWEGHKLSKEEASEVSGIRNVRWSHELDTLMTEVMSYAHQVYLDFNEYPKFFTELRTADLRLADKLKEKYPSHEYRRSAPILHRLRMIKSDAEIDWIRDAIDLTGRAFYRVLKYLRPGVMEYQVQAEIDHEFMQQGVRSHAYAPIIASGMNSCVLHYTSNNDECRDGNLLLMDFGAEYMNYAADLTRTIPVNGKFTERQRACYDSVLKVQKEAIKMFVPGNTPERITKDTHKLMEKEMIALGLFTKEDVKKQGKDAPLFMKYLMHGVAHHIGLDVHDTGSKYDVLEPGMVLTIEPGIYIREEKIGIRLENNILVTKKGPVDLTSEIPIEADEIERIMGG